MSYRRRLGYFLITRWDGALVDGLRAGLAGAGAGARLMKWKVGQTAALQHIVGAIGQAPPLAFPDTRQPARCAAGRHAPCYDGAPLPEGSRHMWKLGRLIALLRKELLLAWGLLRDPRAPLVMMAMATLSWAHS